MKTKIFIGGLNYNTTEDDLLERLSAFGKVNSVRIVTDKETGKSRGFGFVVFETETAAEKAISEMNNSIFMERRVGVKIAIEK